MGGEMITVKLKSHGGRLWNTLRVSGMTNPFELIKQILSLLFIKRRDDLHTIQAEKTAYVKHLIAHLSQVTLQTQVPAEMDRIVSDDSFPFARKLQKGHDYSPYLHHIQNASCTIPNSEHGPSYSFGRTKATVCDETNYLTARCHTTDRRLHYQIVIPVH